jgi:hypothetical protein
MLAITGIFSPRHETAGIWINKKKSNGIKSRQHIAWHISDFLIFIVLSPFVQMHREDILR